jgi:hypothetical protein
MKTILILIGLSAAVALPAGAGAKPSDPDKHAAIAECKVERGKTSASREAFKAKYHSFSRCVRQTTAEEEAEHVTAEKNAAKACKAERAADASAFQEKYGTNANGKNAFGKCVSAKAAEEEAKLDDADEQEAEEVKNAAPECAKERTEMGSEAFAAKYGTNPNKRNAFGKCVSGKARDS